MQFEKNARIAFCYISTHPELQSGISVYTEMLVKHVAYQVFPDKIILLTNADAHVLPELQENSHVEWVAIKQRPGWLPYKIYTLLACLKASLLARRTGCKAFISTTPEGSVIPFVPQIVTFHDIYDFDRAFRPLRTFIYSSILWRWLALVCRNIICVSNATRNEAAYLFPYAAKKMRVITESSKFSNVEIKSSNVETRNSYLLVANVKSTKNIECLLNALRIADQHGAPIRVKWVGRDDEGNIAAWSAKYGLPSAFESLGSISDAELQDVYSQAIALVVPSWKEGFCLPILEAQAFGVPVIVSDLPVLREVAGEGALFFNPHHPEQLHIIMRDFQHNKAEQSRLSDAALRNVRLFSWEKAASQTLDLVR